MFLRLNLVLSLLGLFLCIALSERTNFEGDVVFRVYASEDEQVKTLESLKVSPEDFDFWTPIVPGARGIDLHVRAEKVEELHNLWDVIDLEWEVLIPNLQQLIDEETARQSDRSNKFDDNYYQSYHTYEENIQWLIDLTSTYPNMTSLIDVGTSYEGRTLLAVKVTSPTRVSGQAEKKSIWIDAGIHAREWITIATVTYMLGHFVTDYHNDTTIRSILEQADLYVLLMFNPDGYAYTWDENRMWRKTRSPNSGSPCYGTDPNRNWDYEWDGPGSSTQPCADDYRGPSPFSEIETKSVSNFLLTIPNLVGYINFHSYSQLWMYPWGYSYKPTTDAQVLDEAAKLSVEALESVYGTKYEYGQISTTIYIASGNTVDWTYGTANATYSMAVELRDKGRYGFLLPEDQIVPSGIETLEAFKTYCSYVVAH